MCASVMFVDYYFTNTTIVIKIKIKSIYKWSNGYRSKNYPDKNLSNLLLSYITYKTKKRKGNLYKETYHSTYASKIRIMWTPIYKYRKFIGHKYFATADNWKPLIQNKTIKKKKN